MKTLSLLLALVLSACTLADDALEPTPDAGALDVDATPADAPDAPPAPSWSPLGRYRVTGMAVAGTCPGDSQLPFLFDVYRAAGDYRSDTDPATVVTVFPAERRTHITKTIKTDAAIVALTIDAYAYSTGAVTGSIVVGMTTNDPADACDRTYNIIGTLEP